MTRPIVSDPTKFGGEPHIEGSGITVAEVQAYWRQSGVGAAEARKRFPELSEAELGAAVTYAEPHEPKFSYVAESEGPPRRRLYLWSDGGGWGFAFSEIAPDGFESPGGDNWEERWDRIVLYPEMYAPKSIIWRDERSGEVVDIYAIQPEGDAP